MYVSKKKKAIGKNGGFSQDDKYKYYKIKNIKNVDSNSKDLVNLQSLIGNKATSAMLFEMGNLELRTDSNQLRLSEMDRISRPKEKENDILTASIINKEFSNKHNSAFDKGLYSSKTDGSNLMDVDASEWQIRISEFINLIATIKKGEFKDEKKEIEIKEMDSITSGSKSVKSEVDFLLSLIKKLPDYNENELVKEIYFKVIKMISSTSIDFDKLLSYKSDYKALYEYMKKSISKDLE
ncbi:MAG: hypothetical protein WBA54_09905 [Acidaminobacteraceae bacterium]